MHQDVNSHVLKQEKLRNLLAKLKSDKNFRNLLFGSYNILTFFSDSLQQSMKGTLSHSKLLTAEG